MLTYCNTARNMLFFNYQPCAYGRRMICINS
nr:MAG TPA: hypothetical protein [Caudoviricetes sp.]